MKTIEYAITRLKDAARDGTMENSRFDNIFEGTIVLTGKDEVDAFVKERIRLWLRSWITGPIDDAISILEANKELIDASENLNKALWRDTELARAMRRMQSALETAQTYGER